MLITDIKNFDFDGSFVAKLFAPWCGPCKALAPIFLDIADSMPNVQFLEIDAYESPDVAEKYGVKAVPTILIVKNGVVMDKIVGMRQKDVIAEVIKNYL